MNLFQSLLYSTVQVSFQYLQYATTLKYLSTNLSRKGWEWVTKLQLMHYNMTVFVLIMNNLEV